MEKVIDYNDGWGFSVKDAVKEYQKLEDAGLKDFMIRTQVGSCTADMETIGGMLEEGFDANIVKLNTKYGTKWEVTFVKCEGSGKFNKGSVNWNGGVTK